MSLMGMKRGFEKHGPIWGGLLAFVMIVGVVFTGFGANVSNSGGGQAAANTSKPIATIGDAKITMPELDRQLKQLMDQQAMMGQQVTMTPAEKTRYRYLLLTGMKQQQAMVLAAKKLGVQVTDADIAKKRDEYWQMLRGSVTQALGLKAEATDTEIDKTLMQQAPGQSVARLKMERIPDEELRNELYRAGLAEAVKKQMAVSDEEVKKSYSEIQVRHILVKSGEGGLPDAQAKQKAELLLKEVQANPAKMAELAKKSSDDPGSKDKGGFYDWAPASQYVPEFTKGALEAGLGKVNPQIIKTSYGYHIIKLENERPGKDFPKDWDKEKAKYVDQYKDRIAQQKISETINEQIPSVTVDITDPLLKAAGYIEDSRNGTGDKPKDAQLELAVTELSKVKKEEDPEGAAPLLRATAYEQLNKNKEAIAALEEALTYGNTAETRLKLADLYVKEKDKVNALKQVDEAEKLAIPSPQAQMQLSTILGDLGEKERAKKAMDKATEMFKRMTEQAMAKQGATAVPPQTPATAPAPKASPDAKASPAAAASPDAKATPAAASTPEAKATPAAETAPAEKPASKP